MGLFSRKNKKIEQTKSRKKGIDIELTEEQLDKVTAGVPLDRDWCPRVEVEPIDVGELTEKDLDNVQAGVHRIDER